MARDLKKYSYSIGDMVRVIDRTDGRTFFKDSPRKRPVSFTDILVIKGVYKDKGRIICEVDGAEYPESLLIDSEEITDWIIEDYA